MQPKSKYPSSAAAAGGSKYSSSGAAGVGVPTLMPRTKTQKVSLTDPETKKTRLLSRPVLYLTFARSECLSRIYNLTDSCRMVLIVIVSTARSWFTDQENFPRTSLFE